MNTKQSSNVPLSSRILSTCVLLTALLVAASAQGQAQMQQDKARGEEMLRQARTDLAEANRMSQAAIAATQKAQEDQEAAAVKRRQAVQLQRQAFLLIHDSNRMRAAELRARADEQAAQGRSEEIELRRLKSLLSQQQATATGDTESAALVRSTASTASPAEKPELEKTAQSLTEQASQASAEAAGLAQRIAPISAEVARLKDSIKMEREQADRLAPEEK